LLRRKKNFFFYIYDVITWEKEKKSSANHYSFSHNPLTRPGVGEHEEPLDCVFAVSDARESRAIGDSAPVARILDKATASQVKRPTRVKEKWIWYGNGKTPSATVLEHEVGPEPRFSKGGFYGPGSPSTLERESFVYWYSIQ